MDQSQTQAFARATGGQALKFDVFDSTTGVTSHVSLDYPFAILGRGVDADVFLNHWQVSRRHVYLQMIDGNVFWIDMASRTGMRVNGVAETVGWLTYEDVLSVGSFEIRLSPRAPGSPIPTKPALTPLMNDSSGPDLPTVRLEFLKEQRKSPIWSIQPRLTLIGRSARCKIQIKTPDLSGFHCALVRTEGGLWVVDLLGRGTRVNQVKVRFARLNQDDEINVGKQKIRVLYDAPLPELEDGAKQVEMTGVPALIATRVELAEEPIQMLTRLMASRSPEQAEFTETLLVPLVRQFSQIQQEMVEQFQQTMMSMFNEFGSMYQEQMADFKKELAEVRQLTKELQELQAASSVAEATFNEIKSEPAKPLATPPPTRAIPTMSKPPTQPIGEASKTRQAKPVAQNSASADIHAMLTSRIAAIQTERQTRLQRIMQMILGEVKG